VFRAAPSLRGGRIHGLDGIWISLDSEMKTTEYTEYTENKWVTNPNDFTHGMTMTNFLYL